MVVDASDHVYIASGGGANTHRVRMFTLPAAPVAAPAPAPAPFSISTSSPPVAPSGMSVSSWMSI